MIDPTTARAIASGEAATAAEGGEALFAPWRRGSLGEPVQVHDVFGSPSYWLIPMIVDDRAAGFVRVLASGRVGAIGAYYARPEQLAQCPLIVTGISAGEAARMAAERLEQGEDPASPLFVHDGPPGREAWLVRVSRGGRPTRWIFLTRAGCYERPADQPLELEA